MSTATCRGISDHLMAESIERLTKWLQSVGFSPEESLRGAVWLTLHLDGKSREQARQDAYKIVPVRPTP